ncbi:MAG: hypothetical protein LLF94_01210 [Chlamydiales bacterium]|nr:hypothetical protein [Chlamydiales bacterium]
MEYSLFSKGFSKRSCKCSAPGSLMLMGEHAVLHNKHALSCAVDKRITVHVVARNDELLVINSKLGRYQSDIKAIQEDPRFTFVLKSLSLYLHDTKNLEKGLEITIESEFSHEVGLGSSASVTIATLGALYGQTLSKETLFEKSVHVIRAVQTVGSGADVAASIYGGIVSYTILPLEIEPITTDIPLTLVYSGSKMKTADVIKIVQSSQAAHPKVFQAIFSTMNVTVLEAVQALKNNNLQALGKLFNIHQGLQDALGTCNLPLAEIVYKLRADPNIYGSKISGSGLGDCVIALGTTKYPSPHMQIPVQVSKLGVLYD